MDATGKIKNISQHFVKYFFIKKAQRGSHYVLRKGPEPRLQGTRSGNLCWEPSRCYPRLGHKRFLSFCAIPWPCFKNNAPNLTIFFSEDWMKFTTLFHGQCRFFLVGYAARSILSVPLYFSSCLELLFGENSSRIHSPFVMHVSVTSCYCFRPDLVLASTAPKRSSRAAQYCQICRHQNSGKFNKLSYKIQR